MYLINFRTDCFGVGSNSRGGIHVKIAPQTEEEKQLLEKLQRAKYMAYNGDCVYERLIAGDKVPVDGGPNPGWKILEDFLGEDPIKWASREYEKRQSQVKQYKNSRFHIIVMDTGIRKFNRDRFIALTNKNPDKFNRFSLWQEISSGEYYQAHYVNGKIKKVSKIKIE